MGCATVKQKQQIKRQKEPWDKLNEMILSYSSIEQYILKLRQDVFESLESEISEQQYDELQLQNSDILIMDTLSKDLSLFKRFKKLNKYKYEIVTFKFLKNMKECVFQVQKIEQLNSKTLDELNEFKTNSTSISLPFQQKVEYLLLLIHQVSNYISDDSSPADSYINTNSNSQFYNLELTSMNSKRLSAYQMPPKTPENPSPTQ